MLNESKDIELSVILSLIEIFLSLKNLELNLTQSDKQELLDDIDANANKIVSMLETHLNRQDEILQKIGDIVLHEHD